MDTQSPTLKAQSSERDRILVDRLGRTKEVFINGLRFHSRVKAALYIRNTQGFSLKEAASYIRQLDEVKANA